MIIYACWYGADFDRLARAWYGSVLAHNPGADARFDRLERMPEADEWGPNGEHLAGNTAKLAKWRETVHLARELGEPLVLMDADTFVRGPLDEAFDEFDRSCDIGVTWRPMATIKVNAGVVFVRPTEAASDFFDIWQAENDRLASTPHGRSWSAKLYGGVNQGALSLLLDGKVSHSARLGRLPCVRWNCEQESWARYDADETRVIHAKARLRRYLLHGSDLPSRRLGPAFEEAARLFREFGETEFPVDLTTPNTQDQTPEAKDGAQPHTPVQA